LRKKYTGYTSYSYLEPRKDYRVFKLARQIGRVESSMVPLSKPEEERVEELLEKHVAISFHDHGIVFPEDPGEFLEYVRRGRMWIAYEGLAASGLDAYFEGLFDGIALSDGPDPWSWGSVVRQIGIFSSDLDHQDLLFVARRAEDAVRAHEEGRIAVYIHLEGPPRIGEDLDKVDVLYGLGVRCMGIAYSRGNEFGSGLADEHDRGLSDLGYMLVERMNKLGMLIDLAHAGDRTSLDVIEVSRKPVAVTHAGARALWPTRRMKPDEVIQALAEKGGVIGVEAAPHTTLTEKHPRHSLESVMEHFEYIAGLAGIRHVAFGPDTLFGDHVALHKVFAGELSIGSAHQGPPRYEEVAYVDGLENPSQFTNVVRWLVRHGYSDEEIAMVMGGNILRLLRETIG
jgi:membrane dipeptidase